MIKLNKHNLIFLSLLIPSLYMLFLLYNPVNFLLSSQFIYYDLRPTTLWVSGLGHTLVSIVLLVTGLHHKRKKIIKINTLINMINVFGCITSVSFCLSISLIIILSKIMALRNGLDALQTVELLKEGIKYHIIDLALLSILTIIAVGFKQWIKRQQFDPTLAQNETTGNFGTASWATESDLKSYSLYQENNGIPTGMDDKGRYLYFPLLNKLTISPPGGGKTTSSSIPVLLSYAGPVFVFDVKGELWTTTSRYRSAVLKRNVIVIDPYRVTKGKDFSKGKPSELLKEYRLNPFDWLPEDQRQRDRMINAFAASFVINEGGSATHFDENAKILIRGFIDYMMQSLPRESRNFEMLYHLLSEQQEQAMYTFEQMSQLSGRAAAASNQIGRVGSDERGSILSTSYRQIDWMSDSNIQQALSESNFDLHDFLKGNMDIYIVLPEDQVKEHNRLVRMFLSLTMSIIVQANPSDLPKKKMLFLLEELAQLGYCPDVEQAIEVLRTRGVVVWTVFQSLKQIEIFKKPDLFKGAPIKQIFTNDDTDTMQWIQTLAGKETIMTKSMSINSGDSKQKMQIIGGSISKGEGESIQEVGSELIPINEIREMPGDKQIIFMHSAKPIYCHKTRYFECKLFSGKYDINPLETKNSN